MGYEIGVTPLQLTVAYAAIVNKGIYVETWDSAGTNADRDFTLSVTCSPLGGYSGPVVIVKLP